jgi:hypothetical protein
MKTKLIITVFLWVLILTSMYSKKHSDDVHVADNFVNSIIEHKLTEKEQAERLEYLSTGSTKIYECESDFENIGTGLVIVDTSAFGKGAKVVYCKAGTDKPGYVVSGMIKGNMISDQKNKWSNASMHQWYIRPRMRIKQNLIYPILAGLTDRNWETEICRLEVVNTEGKVVREVEYSGKDFFEKHLEDECIMYYSGNYRDRRSWMELNDSVVVISGKLLNPKARINLSKSRLDFRIYWYGITDMWIDYIKVENETAVDLLKGNYDMWLNAMDNTALIYIKNMKYSSDREPCINYIIGKSTRDMVEYLMKQNKKESN